MTTLLQQAIELAKSGNRDTAEDLIRQSLTENPNNEIAWMWLSGVTRDVLVKREALSRALELNPDNDLAKQGLERFGAPDANDSPPEEVASAEAQVSAATDESSFDENFDEDWDNANWSSDTLESTNSVSPVSPTEETEAASVFTDMPEGFDFNFDMDESPVFDIDLDSLEQPTNIPPSTDTPNDFLNFDEASPFIDDEASQITGAENISDKLEDLFAHSEPDSHPADDFIVPEEEEEPIILTEPETADLVLEDENETGDDIHKLLLKRRKRQNRLLLTAAAFLSILVIGSCSLYYYATEKVDYYLLLPQLAGSELTVEARGANNGVSVLHFNGFPASSATIQWTQDTKADTCKGSNGLSIDFNNGDTAGLYSNSVCKDDNCSFNKSLSPGPISQVEVNYLCGKDAVITLHK